MRPLPVSLLLPVTTASQLLWYPDERVMSALPDLLFTGGSNAPLPER